MQRLHENGTHRKAKCRKYADKHVRKQAGGGGSCAGVGLRLVFWLATGDPPAWHRYPVAGADRPNAVPALQAQTAFRAGTAFAWVRPSCSPVGSGDRLRWLASVRMCGRLAVVARAAVVRRLAAEAGAWLGRGVRVVAQAAGWRWLAVSGGRLSPVLGFWVNRGLGPRGSRPVSWAGTTGGNGVRGRWWPGQRSRS